MTRINKIKNPSQDDKETKRAIEEISNSQYDFILIEVYILINLIIKLIGVDLKWI